MKMQYQIVARLLLMLLCVMLNEPLPEVIQKVPAVVIATDPSLLVGMHRMTLLSVALWSLTVVVLLPLISRTVPRLLSLPSRICSVE